MTLSRAVSVLLLVLLGLLAVGSLLNLSSHPHWFVRGWDFPRIQIVMLCWAIALGYGVLRFFVRDERVLSAWPFVTLVLWVTAWHGFRILPFTPLLPTQSASTPVALVDDHRKDDCTIRMVMTNVEMENDRYQTWMDEMRRVDPDLILVVEVDRSWIEHTKSLRQRYQFEIAEPQDNWYGMMLLSRLPIVDYQVRHLIQEDVPSIDAVIRMDNGIAIRFVGVHPRPPEPIRDNHATARDAELTLWGRELKKESKPAIIGGDLNDVAWSQTTRLFLRTSGLLDPRRGRGFYNTFHADHWFLRFPLDHIFHSPHFTVSRIKRLGFVGSDHFPILIDLRYTPSHKQEHEVMDSKQSDQEAIELRLQRAVEDDDLEGEAVDDQQIQEVNEVQSTH